MLSLKEKIDEHIITIYKKSEIVGKKFLYGIHTILSRYSGKVPLKNIFHIRPGPISKSMHAQKNLHANLLSVSNCFYTDELINLVLLYTHQEIDHQRKNYKNKTSAIYQI